MKAFMDKLNERFTDVADWVSSAMGTPINIILWFLAVLAWFLLFAFNPGLQNSNFMPSWFTSLPFNLPLNLITTLAELYIGFLVAAAANRVERHNEQLQAHQIQIIEHLDAVNAHEEGELSQTEQHLMAQDDKILAILTKVERLEHAILEQLPQQKGKRA